MTDYQKERQIIEWLQEFEAYKVGIENLEENIADIAEASMGISYDKIVTGKTNKITSATENMAIELSELNINKRIKSMKSIVTLIENGLEALNDIEKQVIKGRVIDGLYYYQFCYKIGTSERNAKRIKKEALNKMCIAIFGKE